MQTASRALATALEDSAEYRDFVRNSEAVNTDPEVYALSEEIRQRRASFSLAESGALEDRLEALPSVAAYRAAERALRTLMVAVDGAIGNAAGLAFCEHVRPQGHG
jgi:cell fate (sporulation/competence/biofilm development) regulator YlbF (YheA/YmcA/DUF963 family)